MKPRLENHKQISQEATLKLCTIIIEKLTLPWEWMLGSVYQRAWTIASTFSKTTISLKHLVLFYTSSYRFLADFKMGAAIGPKCLNGCKNQEKASLILAFED